MRYEILGKIRLVDDGEITAVGPAKVETLLTALLVKAGHVVPTEQLVAEMWDDDLPRRSTAALHVCVSQLRKALRRPGRDSPVVTRAAGYRLDLGQDELDLVEFRRLTRHAWTSARGSRHAEAAAACEGALGLWRGGSGEGPAAGRGPIVTGFRTWLYESRLECLELMADSWLQLGRHRELVDMLAALVEEHPLRESLHRQLMLALHGAGRRSDALRAYARARATLRRELGLEPCRALRELHDAILAAGPGPRQLSAV